MILMTILHIYTCMLCTILIDNRSDYVLYINVMHNSDCISDDRYTCMLYIDDDDDDDDDDDLSDDRSD